MMARGRPGRAVNEEEGEDDQALNMSEEIERAFLDSDVEEESPQEGER